MYSTLQYEDLPIHEDTIPYVTHDRVLYDSDVNSIRYQFGNNERPDREYYFEVRRNLANRNLKYMVWT